jgi:hypothetical protein
MVYKLKTSVVRTLSVYSQIRVETSGALTRCRVCLLILPQLQWIWVDSQSINDRLKHPSVIHFQIVDRQFDTGRRAVSRFWCSSSSCMTSVTWPLRHSSTDDVRVVVVTYWLTSWDDWAVTWLCVRSERSLVSLLRIISFAVNQSGLRLCWQTICPRIAASLIVLYRTPNMESSHGCDMTVISKSKLCMLKGHKAFSLWKDEERASSHWSSLSLGYNYMHLFSTVQLHAVEL